MVLDLMTQLDREFSERNKIESLLRELLDAKRNRKSEQLSGTPARTRSRLKMCSAVLRTTGVEVRVRNNAASNAVECSLARWAT